MESSFININFPHKTAASAVFKILLFALKKKIQPKIILMSKSHISQ